MRTNYPDGVTHPDTGLWEFFGDSELTYWFQVTFCPKYWEFPALETQKIVVRKGIQSTRGQIDER